MKKYVEKIVKSLKGKYYYSIILTLVIFILLGIVGYDFKTVKTRLYIDGTLISLKYELMYKDEWYISALDLQEIYKTEVYYDKISRKTIITTKDSVVKLKKDEGYILVNGKQIDIQSPAIVSYNDNDWYSINVIANIFNKTYEVFQNPKAIYLTENEYVDASAIKNNVEVYERESTKKIISRLQKKDAIQIELDDKFNNPNEVWYNVKYQKNGTSVLGKILKRNVYLDYDKPQETPSNDTSDKIIMLVGGQNIPASNVLDKITTLSLECLRLSGVNSITADNEYNMQNINVASTSVYAVITNGYKSSNYDTTNLTGMLNSDLNRQKCIEDILEYVTYKNMQGIIVDFRDFKVTDKELYTQFIKELTSIMHSANKKIIVKVPDADYVDKFSISEVVDYIIIMPYGARTLFSKTSGTHSSVSYVISMLENTQNVGIDKNKVIVELPTYSILWTERRGTVINAETYYMSAVKEYLKSNNVTTTLDEQSGQNYMSYTKGITTYKMWLEDEYSIKAKLSVIKKFNVAGVSLYKSGFESLEVYDIIQNNMK